MHSLHWLQSEHEECSTALRGSVQLTESVIRVSSEILGKNPTKITCKVQNIYTGFRLHWVPLTTSISIHKNLLVISGTLCNWNFFNIYGVFTLSDTENETDNKCTEPTGNLCCYLSRSSVKCFACYSGSHNYHSRFRCRSA